MLVLLSPAKNQHHDPIALQCDVSQPQTSKEIKILVSELKNYSKKKLAKLMSISDSLAELNYERFQSFTPAKFNSSNAKPAAFAFQGDAYKSLNVNDFSVNDLKFMQKHAMILSGLYGYLRPLDLIQAYRLEMKTPLKNPMGKDLYKFWGNTITDGINKALSTHKNKFIVNLASNEYFKAVHPMRLSGKTINIHFKEGKNGVYKTIGFSAKRARGLMTRFIIKNSLDIPNDLKDFADSDYQFSKQLSSDQDFVFIR